VGLKFRIRRRSTQLDRECGSAYAGDQHPIIEVAGHHRRCAPPSQHSHGQALGTKRGYAHVQTSRRITTARALYSDNCCQRCNPLMLTLLMTSAKRRTGATHLDNICGLQ
jgi:hypothetical protein